MKLSAAPRQQGSAVSAERSVAPAAMAVRQANARRSCPAPRQRRNSSRSDRPDSAAASGSAAGPVAARNAARPSWLPCHSPAHPCACVAWLRGTRYQC